MDEKAYRRFREAACKTWYVDAQELEDKIKDLIVQQRSSDAFEAEVRKIILERDTFRRSADDAVVRASEELETRKRAYTRLSRIAQEVVRDVSEANDEPCLI